MNQQRCFQLLVKSRRLSRSFAPSWNTLEMHTSARLTAPRDCSKGSFQKVGNQKKAEEDKTPRSGPIASNKPLSGLSIGGPSTCNPMVVDRDYPSHVTPKYDLQETFTPEFSLTGVQCLEKTEQEHYSEDICPSTEATDEHQVQSTDWAELECTSPIDTQNERMNTDCKQNCPGEIDMTELMAVAGNERVSDVIIDSTCGQDQSCLNVTVASSSPTSKTSAEISACNETGINAHEIKSLNCDQYITEQTNETACGSRINEEKIPCSSTAPGASTVSSTIDTQERSVHNDNTVETMSQGTAFSSGKVKTGYHVCPEVAEPKSHDCVRSFKPTLAMNEDPVNTTDSPIGQWPCTSTPSSVDKSSTAASTYAPTRLDTSYTGQTVHDRATLTSSEVGYKKNCQPKPTTVSAYGCNNAGYTHQTTSSNSDNLAGSSSLLEPSGKESPIDGIISEAIGSTKVNAQKPKQQDGVITKVLGMLPKLNIFKRKEVSQELVYSVRRQTKKSTASRSSDIQRAASCGMNVYKPKEKLEQEQSQEPQSCDENEADAVIHSKSSFYPCYTHNQQGSSSQQTKSTYDADDEDQSTNRRGQQMSQSGTLIQKSSYAPPSRDRQDKTTNKCTEAIHAGPVIQRESKANLQDNKAVGNNTPTANQTTPPNPPNNSQNDGKSDEDKEMSEKQKAIEAKYKDIAQSYMCTKEGNLCFLLSGKTSCTTVSAEWTTLPRRKFPLGEVRKKKEKVKICNDRCPDLQDPHGKK